MRDPQAIAMPNSQTFVFPKQVLPQSVQEIEGQVYVSSKQSYKESEVVGQRHLK